MAVTVDVDHALLDEYVSQASWSSLPDAVSLSHHTGPPLSSCIHNKLQGREASSLGSCLKNLDVFPE